MPRYKIIDRSPRFLPVVLDAQLMSGSFEYALDYLIDHELDLSALDRRYRNDDTGSTAYDPRVLLKIILLAYSRGMISSCSIERACRENVLFIGESKGPRSHCFQNSASQSQFSLPRITRRGVIL